MDLAGNPWGYYDREEPCIHCGAALVAPTSPRPLWSKACSSVAVRLNLMQQSLMEFLSRSRPGGSWIHVVFSKPQ
jgi:hypothetical protein